MSCSMYDLTGERVGVLQIVMVVECPAACKTSSVKG